MAFVLLAFAGGFATCAVIFSFLLPPSPDVDADRGSIERFDRQRHALTGTSADPYRRRHGRPVVTHRRLP